MTTQKFFDDVSFFFDNMTDSTKVISMRKELLKKFIKPGMKTAVDLGCGTGCDSISLGLNGLQVSGFDISEKMIESAIKNAMAANINANFYNYSIDKIPLKFNNKFDLAVSLGNSMTLVEEKRLTSSIKRIYNILKDDGIFIMQILNYTAIKKANNRIVNITQNPPNIYVRFYDLFEMPLNFNILRFNKDNPKDFELLTTKLFPYDKSYLIKKFKESGFKRISFYSNLNKDIFNKSNSKDLVLIASKN